MDGLAELRAAALKALEFQHRIGECEFTLRTPTRNEVRECMHRRGLKWSTDDAMVMALVQRYLAETHVIGWTGVRYLHVVPDAGTAPLPWSRDAVPMLLDAQPDWADALGAELISRMNARNQAIEDAAGN